MFEVKWTESRSAVSDSLQPHGLYSEWNSPGQTTGVGSIFLLQGIFSTQGSHPGLPHCRQILYQLSQQGSASSPIIRLIIREYSRSREKSMKSSLDKVLVASRLWGKFTATSFSPSCKLHTEHCFSQRGHDETWVTAVRRLGQNDYLIYLMTRHKYTSGITSYSFHL